MDLKESEFQILPYVEFDGVRTIRDTTLYMYYEELKKQGAIEKAFYGNMKSKYEFVSFFKSPMVKVYVVYYAGKPAIISWLTNPVYKIIQCHIISFRVGRKIKTEAARRLLTLWLKSMDTITALVPEKYGLVSKLVRAVGMGEMGMIPNAFEINGERQDAIIYCAQGG
jgi:hypothetical protein